MGVSGCSGTGEKCDNQVLIECLSARQIPCNRPESDELSKLAKNQKGLKCFKAADYTNSNDFECGQ